MTRRALVSLRRDEQSLPRSVYAGSLQKRSRIEGTLLWLILGVAAPGWSYRLATWPGRRGLRATALYAVANGLLMTFLRIVVVDWLRDAAARQEQIVADLTRELGREPTQAEYERRLERARAAAADDGLSATPDRCAR